MHKIHSNPDCLFYSCAIKNFAPARHAWIRAVTILKNRKSRSLTRSAFIDISLREAFRRITHVTIRFKGASVYSLSNCVSRCDLRTRTKKSLPSSLFRSTGLQERFATNAGLIRAVRGGQLMGGRSQVDLRSLRPTAW